MHKTYRHLNKHLSAANTDSLDIEIPMIHL